MYNKLKFISRSYDFTVDCGRQESVRESLAVGLVYKPLGSYQGTEIKEYAICTNFSLLAGGLTEGWQAMGQIKNGELELF